MTPQFTYNASVVKVIDGDTVDLTVDLGFHVNIAIRTRLYGINAPEVSTPEGRGAREYLKTVLAPGAPIVVKTFKDPTDKYGRWLAVLQTMINGVSTVNDLMVSSGHAVVYLP
jgi:micrococcal nuclease